MEETQVQIIPRRQEIDRVLNSTNLAQQMAAYFGGDGSKIERFKATMLTLAMAPDMSKWDPKTIVSCGIQVAQVGLSPLPALKQVYFVAYAGKLQAQIGYVGWVALSERMGRPVKAHAVYPCDAFQYDIDGFTDTFRLIPNFKERREDDPNWVMDNLDGIVVLVQDKANDIVHTKYVQRRKLDQLRSVSPSVKKNTFSPWTQWPAEMFMAKAIKYVLSKMPVDERTAIAIQVDNELEIKMRADSQKRGSEVAKEIIEAEIQETAEAPEEAPEQHVE